MDDVSNSGSLVYSRRKLSEVPLELFKVAAHRPIRALDLGYNCLKPPAVAALGDEEPDPERDALLGGPRAGYNASAAARGAGGTGQPTSFKGAAVAVRHLVGSFGRAAKLEAGTGAFSRMSSDGSAWQFDQGVDPKPRLKHLEILYLTHNSLDKLPPELSNVRTLKQLWLNANRLTALPPAVSVLESLEILACNNNAIEAIVPEIGACMALTQLLLRGNRLGMAEVTGPVLPENLGLLTALRVLDLAENKLSVLPIELGRLHTSLQRLNLESNNWRFPSQSIVDQGRARALAFLLEEYQVKLDRFTVKTQERVRALREDPESLGYTREEASALLATATAASKLRLRPGQPGFKIFNPMEVDSGLQQL